MIKRLGDICTFVGGGTPSKKNPDFYNGSIPWATVRDMNVRVIKTTEHSITPDAVQQSATNIIPKGEVVISTHVGLGKVCFLGQDTAINQDLKAVIPNGELSQRYLYYWFISKADELIANGKGATVKGVTLDFVKNLKIHVLPEREQEVVSDTLDKVNHIIELADSQVARLDQLVKSRFVEMFGDPMTNPKGWRIGKVSDLAKYWNGLTYKPENVSETGTIVLRSSNIQGGRLDFADTVRVNISAKEKNVVVPGDVLMCSRNGSAALVGKTAIIPVTDERMYFGAFMMIIRSTVPEYLNAYFSTKAFRSQITCGATSTVNQITCTMMNRVSLPIPPMDLMREFAAFVEKVDKLAFAARQRRDVAKQLYRAKIQEFFG